MILRNRQNKNKLLGLYYDEIIQRKRYERIVGMLSSIVIPTIEKYPFIFSIFIIGYRIIKELKLELYMNVINKLTIESFGNYR